MNDQNSPTVDQLLEYLRSKISAEDPNTIDYSKLRYVIYARKSTTDEQRQEKSIEAQLEECKQRVAESYGLRVVDVIEEMQSAKTAGIRPKFNRMIDELKNGKIDGIITYAADRLARNMKEAGEIIDMLDKGILRDLRFATWQFENSANGKMLLGINFVISKQFSENLSSIVTRGNRVSTERGIFLGKMKHGYIINEDRQLVPDGENFRIIQDAFKLRLKGETLEVIAKWLNKQGYTYRRRGQDARTKSNWAKDDVSLLMKDSTYAGVLKYGDHLNNLVEMDDYDFTPVITVEDFCQINKITDLTDKSIPSLSHSVSKRRAKLLNQMVLCDGCGKRMSAMARSKELKEGLVYYYLFRCDTDGCQWQGKSCRANVIMDKIREVFSQTIFTSQKAYEQYKADAKETQMLELSELKRLQVTTTKNCNIKTKQLEDKKNLVAAKPHLADLYEKDLRELPKEIAALETDLENISKAKERLTSDLLTYEKYLELFSDLSVKLGNIKTLEARDRLVRSFFLNFTVVPTENGTSKKKIQWSVIDYEWTETWKKLFIDQKVGRGRG